MNPSLITVIFLPLTICFLFPLQLNNWFAAAAEMESTVGGIHRGNSSCSSCELPLATSLSIVRRSNNGDVPQLPRSYLVDNLQRYSSRLYRMYSIYQPEVHALVCLLKYYKLFNFLKLPAFLENYWTVFNRYTSSNSTLDTGRAFFPFPDLDYKEKQIAHLTLWHCGKVYLFSFFVRTVEILYFI